MHQCATCQLDFNLPERFDLSYQVTDEEGVVSKQRPVMIHRAILGSLERFIAVLIEHTAGKFPFWVSPRQACIVAVAPKYYSYAESVASQLGDEGYRVKCDLGGDTLKKKIRNAQL
ncbi:threonine-tRNA ligase, class IIa, partial [Kipferlia bialata]|eukprot:g15202.t1